MGDYQFPFRIRVQQVTAYKLLLNGSQVLRSWRYTIQVWLKFRPEDMDEHGCSPSFADIVDMFSSCYIKFNKHSSTTAWLTSAWENGLSPNVHYRGNVAQKECKNIRLLRVSCRI